MLRSLRNRQARPHAFLLGIPLGALTLSLYAVTFQTPSLVESLYSRGLYPYLASALATVSSVTRVSMTDAAFGVMIALLVLVPTFAAHRAACRGSGWQAVIGTSVTWLLATAGWIWSGYVLVWGLNYRRLDVP